MHVAAAIIIASMALLSGCSSSVSVEGDVFVEKDGKATKLALVDIQVIPEDAFKAHIKQQLTKTGAEIARIQGVMDSQEASLANLRQAAADLQGRAVDVAAMGGTTYGSSSLLGQASGILASGEDKIAKMKAEIEGLKTGANGKFFYPAGLQGEIQKVTSDADGKYKLTVAKGKRSILAATKDDKYWLIWLDPSKTNGPVLLTNKNLNGTACGECVFTATATPATL